MLSAVLAVTSIPVMEAQAENHLEAQAENPLETQSESSLEALGLAAYDYTRMESILQDGKELAYRNNSTGACRAAGIFTIIWNTIIPTLAIKGQGILTMPTAT